MSSQNSSKSRLRNLESLHAFVTAATKELMWLNDKEEEEVNFDWSDRNTNMVAKKETYSVSVNEYVLDQPFVCVCCREPHCLPLKALFEGSFEHEVVNTT